MIPGHVEYRVTRQAQAWQDFVYVSGKRPDGRWELLATYELRHAAAPPDGCGGYLPDGRYLHPFGVPVLPAGPGYTGSLDDWIREHGGMTAGDLRTDVPGGG